MHYFSGEAFEISISSQFLIEEREKHYFDRIDFQTVHEELQILLYIHYHTVISVLFNYVDNSE